MRHWRRRYPPARPHLGDVAGEPPLPLRPLPAGPAMRERRRHVIAGAVALLCYAVVLLVAWNGGP